MRKTRNFDQEIKQYISNAIPQLSEAFSEVLTVETKKIQRELIVSSFLLYLVSFNAISFVGDMEFAGVKFNVTAREVILIIGSLIALYLLTLFSLRCYTDWSR